MAYEEAALNTEDALDRLRGHGQAEHNYGDGDEACRYFVEQVVGNVIGARLQREQR